MTTTDEQAREGTLRDLTHGEVRLARASARNLEAQIMQGCGDNSCRFRKGPAGGMGTNGGCLCRDQIQTALEVFARSVAPDAEITRLREENAQMARMLAEPRESEIEIATLRAQVGELTRDLQHIREQAGPDSCADYAARNREHAARITELEGLLSQSIEDHEKTAARLKDGVLAEASNLYARTLETSRAKYAATRIGRADGLLTKGLSAYRDKFLASAVEAADWQAFAEEHEKQHGAAILANAQETEK